MSTEYVGSVIFYLGVNEVEVAEIDVKDNIGKRPVKTMNRIRRVKGFTRGVSRYDIIFTVVVPTDDVAADWAKIDSAKISPIPDVEGVRPTSYLGFCATEVGDSYTVDNELVADVTDFVTRKVSE